MSGWPSYAASAWFQPGSARRSCFDGRAGSSGHSIPAQDGSSRQECVRTVLPDGPRADDRQAGQLHLETAAFHDQLLRRCPGRPYARDVSTGRPLWDGPTGARSSGRNRGTARGQPRPRPSLRSHRRAMSGTCSLVSPRKVEALDRDQGQSCRDAIGSMLPEL